MLPEAEVLFWLALSAAGSWLLTLHLRRRWRRQGNAEPEIERRPSGSALERPLPPPAPERAQIESRRPESAPWQLDEAVGRLVAAANRLAAHADLIELTERLNDLAERMEKPLGALELALAPRAADGVRAQPESERPETHGKREPAASARFVFADHHPAPAAGGEAVDQLPDPDDQLPDPVSQIAERDDQLADPDDDALVGVEPRGLFELESARSFADADRAATHRGRPVAARGARPLAGREALEITALGIGDSEALEPEA